MKDPRSPAQLCVCVLKGKGLEKLENIGFRIKSPVCGFRIYLLFKFWFPKHWEGHVTKWALKLQPSQPYPRQEERMDGGRAHSQLRQFSLRNFSGRLAHHLSLTGKPHCKGSSETFLELWSWWHHQCWGCVKREEGRMDVGQAAGSLCHMPFEGGSLLGQLFLPLVVLFMALTSLKLCFLSISP